MTRQSLRSTWPLLLGLAVFLFTMFPWEHRTTQDYDTGTGIVFYLALVGAGFLSLVIGGYPWLRRLDHLVQPVYDWLLRLKSGQFMLLVFGLVFAAANLISLLVFEHIPHVHDSIAQLFQARIFASGRLYLPSPAFPDFFDYTHVINNGRWYSQYPPMHSLLLMFGVLAGVPWLVNPLLGALTAPVIYLLGRELYDEKTGRVAGLLVSCSPFLVNMSSEFMNHTSTLLFMSLFMLFFFRTLSQGRAHHALLAGLCLGLATDVRPYTALALAFPFAAYVYLTHPDLGQSVRRFTPLLVALGLTVGLMLVYNWLVNGDPLLFGYVVRWGRGHEIGFGKSGWGTAHTPLRGLINTGNNLNGLNRYLFEWPLPALLPIILLFSSGSADRRDWLLLASFMSLVVAYFFYWYQDLCFGPRFLFESAACLILLTARSGLAPGPLLRRLGLRVPESEARGFIKRLLPLVLLITLAVGIPPLYLRKYASYYNINAQLLRRVRRAALENSLVFCRQFGEAFNANALDLTGPVVYAQHFGLLDAALTAAYPRRSCYFGHRDTLDDLHDPTIPIRNPRLELQQFPIESEGVLKPLRGLKPPAVESLVLVEPEIGNIDYEQSELKSVLDQMSLVLARIPNPDYRAIIWPFADLPPATLGLLPYQPELTDFRRVSNQLFAGTHTIEDFIPAVACWIIDDPREHAWAFGLMNRRQNYILGGIRCTVLYETPDSLGIIYDLRRATGEERVRDLIEDEEP